MKYKNNAITIILLLVLIILTACSQNLNKRSGISENKNNSRFDVYYDNKVKYIGDNVGVVNLLNILEVGDLGEFTIALTTDKAPYGLTINYSNLKDDNDGNKFKAIGQIDYAFYLLALVDNLDEVDINYNNYNYHLDLEEANLIVKGNIKSFGSTSESLKELNDIINPLD